MPHQAAAEFEALFSSYVAASRSEDGCIEYHMTLFIFYEIWQSKHLDVHCCTWRASLNNVWSTWNFDIRRVVMISPSSAVR
jgi:quinol monooxygenase YgiN